MYQQPQSDKGLHIDRLSVLARRLSHRLQNSGEPLFEFFAQMTAQPELEPEASQDAEAERLERATDDAIAVSAIYARPSEY